MRSGDGANAIQNARINKSFKAGTPLTAVLKEIAKSLGVGVSDALNEIQKHVTGSLPRGKAVSGNSMLSIQKILETNGLSASIQDGSLQVLKEGRATPKKAVVLNYQSGHLTGEASSKIQCLLMPELRPGSRVVLKNSKVKKVVHTRFVGSLYESQWYAEIQCEAV